MATIVIDDHILLRDLAAEDAGPLFATIDRERQHLGPWLNWVAKTTRQEHSAEFIQRAHTQVHDQSGLALGIFYDGEIIGLTGMHNWDHDTKRAELGYWISRGHEGKGIVSRALAGFMDHLFTHAGLNKIEIRYIPANKRSGRVAERLGFRIEGVLRKAVMSNGAAEDIVVTGLLKTEWRDRNR